MPVGNCYYARLTVREEDVCSDPGLRGRIHALGAWESWMGDGGEDFLSVEDGEARNGEFREIEAELAKLGIPFDRFTDGYGSFQPRERRFRPGREGRPAVDAEVVLTVDGEPFVVLGRLREVLRLEDPAVLRARLAELIERAEPVPRLEEWARVNPGVWRPSGPARGER